MFEFEGKKHASFEEIKQFINDSMIEFIKINEDQKKPLDKPELTGMRAFHALLIKKLEEAEKIK